MKPALLVIGHLAAAFLLSEFAGREILPAGRSVVLLAECRAQITLLVIWLGLGRGSLRWRLWMLPIGLAADSLFFAWRFERFHGQQPVWGFPGSASIWEDIWVNEVFLGASALGCVFALLMLRTRFVLVAGIFDKASETAWQFSLRQILGLIFISAVLFAVGRWMQERHFGGADLFDIARWLTTAVHAVFQSLIALAAVWAALRPGRPDRRMLLAVIAGVVIGAVNALRIRSANAEMAAALCALGALETLIVAGSLLVVRSSGWRLVRRGGGPI